MTKLVLILSLATSLFTLAQPSATPATPPAATPAAEEPTPIPDDGVRVAVLGYHDFSETLPETEMRMRTSKFRKQMETLRQEGLTVISFNDFDAWKRGEKSLPPRCVLITIDDGWKAVYTDAYPILKEFGYPFTLFLYTNYIDGGGRALTTAMVQEMIQNGAAIHSHSVSHPFPAAFRSRRKKNHDLYLAFIRTEMGDSKTILEQKFPGQHVTAYAYPGGFNTEEMHAVADEVKYQYLFTVLPGKVKRDSPNKTLPRYMPFGNTDRPFQDSITFREGTTTSSPSLPGGPSAKPETTPYPVQPEPGSIINTRTPEIVADLSTVPDLDPKTLTMKISGFGEVPATYSPETKQFSWKMNRRLRQKSTLVRVDWKNTAGKAPQTPLRWSFQIDRIPAYLPESE
ncbi:MAG: polysaccharide deacetylase family protein [Luteolibacter sp.]